MKRLLLVLVATALWLATNAQGTANLQETIDALASAQSRADGITDIDLSLYGPQTKTLEIRNGVKVRFVNGTLTCVDTWKGTVVNISGDSYLELAQGAKIKAGTENYNTSSGIVSMNGGQFIISGGRMESYDLKHWSQFMIKTQSGNNVIEVSSGFINGFIRSYNNQDNIELTGGTIWGIYAKYQETPIIIGNAYVSFFISTTSVSDHNIIPQITSEIKTQLTFMPKAIGAIAKQGAGYNITENDLKKIEVSFQSNDKEWEVYLDGEYVKFREKQDGMKNAADLQAAIDALTGPGTIEIPEAGVLIDGPINIGTHDVTLTGGPLNVVENYDAKTNADFVFSIPQGGKLTLKNITYNENNNYHHYSRFLVNEGELVFDYGFRMINPYKEKNSRFINASKAKISYNDGIIELYRGYFIYSESLSEININGGEISVEAGIAIFGEANVEQNRGWIYCPFKVAINLTGENSTYTINEGGTVDGGRCDAVSAPHTYYYSGTIKGNHTLCTGTIGSVIATRPCPDFSGTKIVSFEGVSSVSGNVFIPKYQIDKSCKIYLTSKITYEWNISGWKWQEFELNKPFILSSDSYKMTKADFEMMTFIDLPSNRVARFNEAEGYVYLDSPSLQDFIDQLVGDEDGDGTIKTDGEDIDVDEDVTFPEDLQAVIDGLGGDGSTGSLNFKGGDLHISPGACVTLTNIILDGCGKGHHIYVDGTLVIDATVKIYKFIDIFIHVRRGGRVIWRGGNADYTDTNGINVPIYNEGGTVEYHGGNIYGHEYGIQNIGGAVIIYGGTINGGNGGGVYNGHGGSVIVNGGFIYGGFINYGKTEIFNCEIHGGMTNPGVTNYGDFTMHEGSIYGDGSGKGIVTVTDIHICGCVPVEDIYITLGARIYITAKIETVVRIHVTIDGDVPGDSIIISGAGGYTLTQADFDNLSFFLPTGWVAKFNPGTSNIEVSSPAGVGEVTYDGAVYDVYNLQGVKVGKSDDTRSLPDGLYIINGEKVMLHN